MVRYSRRIQLCEFFFFVSLGLFVAKPSLAQNLAGNTTKGNRISYLDRPCDPYYVGTHFPKLITPQWVGEEGVDAVVVLAIDDMRDPVRYEEYLRPIIKRLKEIDGRAPISIMTNQVNPNDKQVAQWVAEGLTIDIHTIDHPCPCLKDSDFGKAKATYDDCVDLMFEIPGNQPTTFRMPCCDSLNTPSPRFWSEIFNRTTKAGHFLAADSSVFQMFTPEDPDLPADLLRDGDGGLVFDKYVPFPSFANTIRNYPYPYLINGICWEFPCMVPSDWQAQHLHQPNNPITVNDMKLALDLTVLKKGVMNLVFHPHGWIRSEQVVELIDHAVAQHGSSVKFMTFAEAMNRLNQNLLLGTPMRDENGREGANRIVDLNGDGFMDVVQSEPAVTRVWNNKEYDWDQTVTPFRIGASQSDDSSKKLRYSSTHVNRVDRFGILHPNQTVVVSSLSVDHQGDERRLFEFNQGRWCELSEASPATKVLSRVPRYQEGEFPSDIARGLFRDIDGDQQSEWIQQEDDRVTVYWRRQKVWQPSKVTFPGRWRLFPTDWRSADSGVRLLDLNGDGRQDLIASDEIEFGAWLFQDLETGWSRPLRVGKRGDRLAIPVISRNGTNNGAWFHSETLWVQNEDTARLPDLVERLKIDDLINTVHEPRKNLGMPLPLSPEVGRQSIRVPVNLEVELVACEPLIADPVAFDWGPDGRLWVAEMGDYPEGVEGQDHSGGRVRVLSDTDGDGQYDASTVFADNLPFPTGIKVWRDSILISTAPEVLQAFDRDGDDHADEVVPIFRGFSEGNQQHRVNGLRYGLDHRLYLANGDSGGVITSVATGMTMDIRGRDLWVQPDSGEMGTTTGQTQFGRNRDDWQNWFGGNNSNPMWHYVLDEHYLKRNPHVSYPSLRKPVSVKPGTSPVFPLSKTLDRFNDLQMANRFTSACSPNIYRDRWLGESYVGNAFVCEPVHNLVHREVMQAEGASWSSERPEGEKRSEFLASHDTWFRPVMIRTAPDGSLWVADMYRLVIEHPEWITPQRQAELDLRSGEDRGRIYRVKPRGVDPPKILDFEEADLSQLLDALASTNGWVRDTAQQILIWGDRMDAVPALRNLLSHPLPTTRLHAIATLSALKRLSEDDLIHALHDPHPGVRRWGIVCSESFIQSEKISSSLCEMAQSEENQQVLVQLACSLGADGSDKGVGALAGLMQRYGDQPWIRAACASSIRRDSIASLVGHLFKSSDLTLAAAMRDQVMQTAAAWMTIDAFDQFLATSLPEDISLKSSQADWWAAINFWHRSGREIPQSLKVWLEGQKTWARNALASQSAKIELKTIAIDLLALGKHHLSEDVEIILNSLEARAAPQLREKALGFIRQQNEIEIAHRVLSRWNNLTPSTRQEVIDSLLSRPSWVPVLVNALDAGQIRTTELSVRNRSQMEQIRDADLRLKIQHLFASDPPSNRVDVVKRYLESMPHSGDMQLGRSLFSKHCASCHRLAGVGNPIGPDLSALTDKSNRFLVTAILDPNRAIEDKYLQYLALTHEGSQFAGLIMEESSTFVNLALTDGKQKQIRRSDLSELTSTTNSLMPEGLEKILTPKQMANLILFLRDQGQASKKFAGNSPKLIVPESTGRLLLDAKHAKIFGPSIVFESTYQNLGWWSDPKDHASWEVEIKKSGQYRVIFDYACAAGSEGGDFEMLVGEVGLVGRVRSSGTWDDYHEEDYGVVELPVGKTTILVRPKGEISNPLIDLRRITLSPVVD